MTWLRRSAVALSIVVGMAALSLAAWAIAIGPVAMWRVLTHGTTTVWDHLEYPGRPTSPSTSARPWPTAYGTEPIVQWDGQSRPINALLEEGDGLVFLIVHQGSIVHEWNRPGHSPDTPVMLFSVSKSITSLLVGAAIDDGLIDSVTDPITDYVPELTDFVSVTIEDALRMDTDSTYVENDNPFGVHVEFNYTPNLERDILGLEVREEPSAEFAYKSGDNAILGLILHRVLAPESITSYLQRRLLDPLSAEHPGMWSTDDDDGVERTWCCLALAARDLARFGQLVLDAGAVGDTQVISPAWLAASLTPAYGEDEWPDDYAGSALINYGYQWWLVEGGAVLALGKGGQYLYIDPAHDLVIVRTGTSQGDISWLTVLREIADQYPRG